MSSSLSIIFAVISIVIGYLLLDPLNTSAIYGLPFDPEGTELPDEPSVAADSEDRLAKGLRKYEGEIFGPESIAFDPQGRGPYISLSDGRVIRRNADDTAWEDFATASPNWTAEMCGYRTTSQAGGESVTAPPSRILAAPNLTVEHICGRPLGLRFHPITGELFFCDAYYGLHKVGLDGGKAQLLVDSVDGQKLLFTNDVDIDADNELGTLYFTDTSPRHRRRDFVVAFLEGRAEGRLMKYDLRTGESSVLVRGLRFANGVALSKNRDFIVYCETSLNSCSRYWLKGEKAGTKELFVSLPGVPDNVRLNPRGRFWVGLHAHRSSRCQFLANRPQLRHVLLKMPFSAKLWYLFCMGLPHGLLVEVDEEGKITDLLEDVKGKVVRAISEVEEHGGKLWIGSVIMPFVAVVDYKPPK